MAGLYVHIPFCASKCIYCDFYSVANRQDEIDTYLDALLIESKLRSGEVALPIHTVYIGGGTPSILDASQFTKLVDGLRKDFDFSAVEEFTVEVNPDDVTPDFISKLMDLGVNRVSMGVQSFVDKELALVNRRHNAIQAKNAVQVLTDAGIDNISIDLIYGIPNQTMDTWKCSVQEALSLKVPHVSAYSMMYEKGTRLWVMREARKILEVAEDTCIAMYDYLVKEMKKNGYIHYEISNFALPGLYSRHNSSYWDLTPYLGLGVAAHSFDGECRRANPNSLKEYVSSLQNGKCAYTVEFEEDWERYDEFVMLSMRTANGLDFDKLQHIFHHKYIDYFMRQASKLIEKGNLATSRGMYYIPENKAMLLDAITRELMWDV